MALVAMAQDVEFKASAPAQVIMGRPFQLTYSVNQRAKDLRAPEFTDFDYIAMTNCISSLRIWRKFSR